VDSHNLIITILVYALPMIFAITLHEAAHGFVAKRFGDSTAYMLGRVTLNPLKHIDWLGTVVVPLITKVLGGFFFGWAKPVPVNFNNLRDPKRDMLWVAAAGPASNLAQLVVWALAAAVLGRTVEPSGQVGVFWFSVANAGIEVNIMFALLNLLPILPLDGGRIVASLLPRSASNIYQQSERFGLVILLVLLFSGAIGYVLSPLYRGMYLTTMNLIGLA
jgi:Zn-dependent protease